MYLKRIYVNGFKSFAEKTEISVEKGITAIVGPNGSGKSNISDAIKWVLGEQSAKSLRGGKMDDVIFAGTQKRMPLGYAEVNLVFDNESGIIPLEYREVSIRRKLYKTGESEYYINKQQCRLKDIKELFMDTGIGRDGYSFIGQGRVEDILSPNSETRREVFEEAAGIVKYKARKEEAGRKLDKTNDNLSRVQDIIHELEERLEPLAEQSRKASRYIELKDNLKKYELNYFVHEYEKYNEQYAALENQRNQAVEQKYILQKKREHLEKIISAEKEKINELQDEISELERLHGEKNKEYEGLLSLTNVQREKRLLYNSNTQNVKDEIDALNKRNDELEEAVITIEAEKQELSDGLKNITEKFNTTNSEIIEYKAKIDEVSRLIEERKNELFELHKEINKLNSSKSTLESFIKNDEERIEQLSKEIEAESAEKKRSEETITAMKQKQEETLVLLSLKREELNKLSNDLKANEDLRDSVESEMRKIKDSLSQAKSKLNILSNMEAYYDGYNKSIKTLMNSKDKNTMLRGAILGTVADIVSTKKEYETAIEIALGSSIQNIIVNSEKDASNIIEYLKSNKVGRVTLLPIEMIQERGLSSVEKAVMSDPCVIDTGDMLVETDPKFKKVVRHLLGRIIIVDDLNNGFKISRRLGSSVKIVTLQGDVINAGGSVTGGHIINNQNLLGRKREIEECRSLNEEYERALSEKNRELEGILKGITQNKAEIEGIKALINEKNSLYSTTESQINMLREQLTKVSGVIHKYENERQYIIDEKNKHAEEIFIYNGKIAEYKEELENKERDIEEISGQNRDNTRQYEEFNRVISAQRDEAAHFRQSIQLKEERCRSIDDEIIRNLKAAEIKEENLKSIEEEIKKSSEIIEEYSEKTKALGESLTSLSGELALQKNNLVSFQNQIYEYQGKINETNKAITEILDDENGMNVKIERAKARVEDISGKLWEEYEMNYAMALGYKDTSVSYSKMYSEVNGYKRAVKELGNVNLDAIEEFKDVKERHDFLTLQRNDLINARYQLNDVIRELEEKMKDKFLEEFACIRLKFNEVFRKLFNGGSGDVYLEDENDALNSNIEIAVQPPGKKLSKISLLSGGEKSLTAIALLFAILKTKPTPFCILDEIEAALDDANIFRFSQYLKEFSDETQFMIITHRKGTMEYADTLYGATMEEKGVTKLVSMKLSAVSAE